MVRECRILKSHKKTFWRNMGSTYLRILMGEQKYFNHHNSKILPKLIVKFDQVRSPKLKRILEFCLQLFRVLCDRPRPYATDINITGIQSLATFVAVRGVIYTNSTVYLKTYQLYDICPVRPYWADLQSRELRRVPSMRTPESPRCTTVLLRPRHILRSACWPLMGSVGE